jgi:N-acetyl-anhydromuramyl-L-alanine amidase AmpD
MRKINLIVIHCSATRSNQSFTVEDLRASHNDQFHGKGIGYHYYITRDGQVYQTRSEAEIGMHARRYNAHSIGICYEGGLDEKGRAADTRTPQQRASLIALLRALKVDYPQAEIMGHCELKGVHKDCPCFSCQEYRDYFNNLKN